MTNLLFILFTLSLNLHLCPLCQANKETKLFPWDVNVEKAAESLFEIAFLGYLFIDLIQCHIKLKLSFISCSNCFSEIKVLKYFLKFCRINTFLRVIHCKLSHFTSTKLKKKKITDLACYL